MDKNMQLANTSSMSLSKATIPLLVVSRLVGMNPKSQWHKIYTVLIIVGEISVLSYVWQFHINRQVENYFFRIFVHALGDVCRITSLLLLLAPNLFDRNRYIVPLKDLANIDGRLKSLNGYIDNRGTYRFQILLVTYVGFVMLLFGLVKTYLYILPEKDGRPYGILLWNCFFYLTTLVACTVADCSFASTLSIIKRRFEEINSIISRVRSHGSYLRVNFLQVSRARTDNDALGKIRILRKQYHNLWIIANQVNKAYGLHLLMGATSTLALMTSQLWKSYSVFMTSDWVNSHITFDGIIWALFYVTRMFLLVKFSESTVAEAKITSVMLQELDMEGDHDTATKGEIRDFLTQLQFEVLKFTACGFFDIDFTLICALLGAACTYLVILIQMGDPNACVQVTDYSINETIHFANGNQSR